jgi:murein DD-endopeptidase MepM/ murein hydrolase activator NlpD
MQNRRVLFYLASVAGMVILSACSSSFGKLAKSNLEPDLVTRVYLPANAPTISQRFLSPATHVGWHRGFDMLVPYRTPVLAAADGTVSVVRRSILYGNQIFIDHGLSAPGYALQTRYFHLTQALVEQGQLVRRGELIAYSGSTGLLAAFLQHLHFEVHRLSESDPPIAINVLDPQRYWIKGVGRVTCFEINTHYPVAPIALTYPVPCNGVPWAQLS